MDEILENKVVECFFDFDRALILIQLVLKEKNVKNWNLFNKIDLRKRWTELEIEKFRINDDNLVYNLTKEDIFPEKYKEELDKEFLKQVEFIKNNINEEEKNKNDNNDNNDVVIKISEGDIDEEKLEKNTTLIKPITINDLDEID